MNQMLRPGPLAVGIFLAIVMSSGTGDLVSLEFVDPRKGAGLARVRR